MSGRILSFLISFLALVVYSSLSYAEQTFDLSFESQLVDAADGGHQFEVTRLLQSGTSPNTKGAFDTTALMRAAFKGHEKIVKILLESGADVHAKDIGGATALHLASRQGNKRIVELLLKHGADTEVEDKEGYSPTKRAVKSEQVRVVQVLVEEGADIDDKGALGSSPLEMAKQNKNNKIVQILENKEKEERTAETVVINEAKEDHKEEDLEEDSVEDDQEEIEVAEVVEEGEAEVEEVIKEEPKHTKLAIQSMPWVDDKSQTITKNKEYTFFKPADKRNQAEPKQTTIKEIKQTPIANLKEKPAKLAIKGNPWIEDKRFLVSQNRSYTYFSPMDKTDLIKKDFNQKKSVTRKFSTVKDLRNIKRQSKVSKEELSKPVIKKISVAEAIKLPDDLDLSNENNVVEKRKVKQTKWEYAAGLGKKIRKIWMEITGFANEDAAISLWHDVMQNNYFKGASAKLVLDKNGKHKRPTLRIGKFTKSSEVFKSCKKVREINPGLLCYAVHDIY